MGVDQQSAPPHGLAPPGKSALHWAAAVNNVEATIALLKNGANKDMQDSKVSGRRDGQASKAWLSRIPQAPPTMGAPTVPSSRSLWAEHQDTLLLCWGGGDPSA